MDKRPTLRTIAEASGLAVTTVSRALAGDGKIAQSTRSRVAEIAERLGYIPDRAAQRLRTGRTNVISLVMSPHEELLSFRGLMIAGLSQAIAGTRFHISMTPYDIDADPMVPIRHILRNGLADGIVFSGTQPDDPRVAFLNEAGFPFVSHGRTETVGAHAWCDYDNAAFAAMAVARLAERGRRRAFLIQPPHGRTFARHMREGFVSACARHGLTPVMDDAVTLWTPAAQINLAAARLCTESGIDAFVCPGEVAAMAVLAGLQDAGHRVGEGVDVLAKQAGQVFDLYRPRIDTIYEDILGAGRTLGQLLLRRIAGEPVEALQVLQAPQPNFRTAPAPRP